MNQIISALDSMEASVLSVDDVLTVLETQIVQVALIVETHDDDEFEEEDVQTLAKAFCQLHANHPSDVTFVTNERAELHYERTWDEAYYAAMRRPGERIPRIDWRAIKLPPLVIARIARAVANHAAAATKAWYEYNRKLEDVALREGQHGN